MPKSAPGRLLFGIMIIGLLLIIGRNMYRYVREMAFENAVARRNESAALTLWRQGVYAGQPAQGKRALFGALKRNLPALACHLLQNGVDPNSAISEGTPALNVAIENCPDAVKCLLEKGADVNAGYGMALKLTALRRRTDLARLLLDRGADVNANGSADEGLTALSHAISQQDIAMMRLLLERGAIADAMPRNAANRAGGLRPLADAAAFGNVEMVTLLLEYSGSGAAKDDALRAAGEQNRKEIIPLLLKSGAQWPQITGNKPRAP